MQFFETIYEDRDNGTLYSFRPYLSSELSGRGNAVLNQLAVQVLACNCNMISRLDRVDGDLFGIELK